MDGRIEPFAEWKPEMQLHLRIDLETDRASLHVRLNQKEKTILFNASVNEIARNFVATKMHIPRLSTLDDCGKYGTKDQVLPQAGEPVSPTEIRIEQLSWKHAST